jgi:hypothetical protein
LTTLEICIGAAMAQGVVTEALAAALGLWRYRHPGLIVANIALMFGLVQGGLIAGGLSGGVSAAHPLANVAPVMFMAGALVGLGYEGLNSFALNAWTWSDKPLAGLKRPLDKAAAVGVLWGLVPVTAALAASLVP